MLKAAVIGLGWWGKQIVTCLSNSKIINVTHGVDVDIDNVSNFAFENGLSIGDSYDNVLSNPEIDAVILVTPHLLHEKQVIAAAKSGKQIFCEKPFALNKSHSSCNSSYCFVNPQ